MSCSSTISFPSTFKTFQITTLHKFNVFHFSYMHCLIFTLKCTSGQSSISKQGALNKQPGAAGAENVYKGTGNRVKAIKCMKSTTLLRVSTRWTLESSILKIVLSRPFESPWTFVQQAVIKYITRVVLGQSPGPRNPKEIGWAIVPANLVYLTPGKSLSHVKAVGGPHSWRPWASALTLTYQQRHNEM